MATDTDQASAEPVTPLLVFDGQCGFCRRFIPRWRQLTGDRVRYEALADAVAAGLTGAVTPDELRQAVHLFLPDGRVVRGAEAVAELGGYTGRAPIFRAAYRHVPGFKVLADFGYRVTARQRVAANTLTRWFIGPDLRRPRRTLVRWLFLQIGRAHV